MRTACRLRRPLLCLLLALACLLTGCGAKREAAGMTVDIKDGRKVCTGTEQRFYRVEDGQTGELAISILREDGDLAIAVFPAEDPEHCCYRGSELPTSDFSVTLSGPGSYTVQIEADRFIGSYGLEWTANGGSGE